MANEAEETDGEQAWENGMFWSGVGLILSGDLRGVMTQGAALRYKVGYKEHLEPSSACPTVHSLSVFDSHTRNDFHDSHDRSITLSTLR